MADHIGRREFMQSSRWLGSALLAGTLTETSRGFSANDTLQVGLIGTGGRCRRLIKAFPQIPNVRITAICDVREDQLEETRKLLDSKIFITPAHEELLSRKDVDVVLIATPDHWHAALTIAACEAGKDVYVEKPLTHHRQEGQPIIDAKNKSRRIVQVGTQQRSMPHIQKARELLPTIGIVHKVRLCWNRNTPRARQRSEEYDPKRVDWKRFLGKAKDQPFDAYRMRQWRWFWDFGGGIFTDLMVHWIDVVHWFLGLDHPATALSIGDWFSAKGLWETPDTVQTLMRYPDNQLQVHFEGTFSSNRNGSMVEFMGTEGTLYIDRGRYEIIPDRGKKSLKPSELVLGAGERGLDFYDQPDGELLHLANWVECVRRGQPPAAPVEAGVSAAAAAHLANESLRSGQVATWM